MRFFDGQERMWSVDQCCGQTRLSIVYRRDPLIVTVIVAVPVSNHAFSSASKPFSLSYKGLAASKLPKVQSRRAIVAQLLQFV
jgi:hypothetical protein